MEFSFLQQFPASANQFPNENGRMFEAARWERGGRNNYFIRTCLTLQTQSFSPSRPAQYSENLPALQFGRSVNVSASRDSPTPFRMVLLVWQILTGWTCPTKIPPSRAGMIFNF
jgi:hypothetical protein